MYSASARDEISNTMLFDSVDEIEKHLWVSKMLVT